jgi:hypothetical protein
VLLVSVLWVQALSLAVEGDTNCPEPSAVAARLQAVAPSGRMPGRALLSQSEGALRVQLVRANGTIVGERLLDARYPCPELAEAAALVLASWQGEFGALPVTTPAVTATAPAARTPWFELGVGLLAAAPRPLSAGGSLSVGLNRGAWGLGFQLMAVDFHREPAEGGAQISWNRSPISLTVRRRFKSSRSVVVSLDAGMAGAALLARSSGFELAHSSLRYDYGPTIGGQVLFDTGGQILPYLGISSAVWLQRRIIQLSDTRRRVLPQIDAWLVLGLSWRLDAH